MFMSSGQGDDGGDDRLRPFDRPGRSPVIAENGMAVVPLDISDLYAVEIDFAEDLERANLFV